MNVSDLDLGWLAGLFDGEGCITRAGGKYGHPELTITNTDSKLIEKAQRVLDALEIDSSITTIAAQKVHYKVRYSLRVNSSAGIQRFFTVVPIQSKEKHDRYEALKSELANRHRSHTVARRQRLARQYPALL